MGQINLRLPDELRKLAERYAKHYGYKNLQELAKESIRVRISKDIGEIKKVRGAMSGRDIVERLTPETRKELEEISKISKTEWKKWYKTIKKKERERAKSLMQAY